MRILLAVGLLVSLSGCTGVTVGGPDGPVVEGHATRFEGGDLTVQVGDTVTFKMVEASHTVDFSEDGDVPGVSAPHSGHLDEGDTFEVTFTEPGTYPYFCLYHSSLSGGERVGMVGTITVE